MAQKRKQKKNLYWTTTIFFFHKIMRDKATKGKTSQENGCSGTYIHFKLYMSGEMNCLHSSTSIFWWFEWQDAVWTYFPLKSEMKTTDAVRSNISAQVFILNAISLCSFTHERASISVTTDDDNAACLSVVVCWESIATKREKK